MQRSILVFISLIFSLSIISAQQIDTLRLKNEVLALKSHSSKKAFLQKLIDEDQEFRGNSTNDSLDFQHLVSTSYYFNEHGYPKRKDYGIVAEALLLVWIHGQWREINRLSFPLIRKGFLIGEIEQFDFRCSLLRHFHKFDDEFGDERCRTMPMKELLEICEVEISNKISIKKMIEAKVEIDSIAKIKIVNTSNWKKEGVTKTYEVNGKQVTMKYDPMLMTVYEKADGKKYLFHNVYRDYLGGPSELVKIGPNKYRYSYKTESDHYFEFLKDKMLYKNKTEILELYNKTTDSKGYNWQYR